jgi:hypothetical protein
MNKKKAEKKFNELKQLLVIYENNAKDLRDSFKALFPARVCPVFLARDANANSPMYWRYSSLQKNKLGARVKVDEFGNNEFWEVISGMSDTHKAQLSEFEITRISLNYKISTTKYKIARLGDYFTNLKNWETGVRKL